MREPLAEWLNPRVEFSYAGARWPILFDHRALLVCERLTGVDMLASDIGAPTAKFLRALLFVALDRAGGGLDLREVGNLIRPSTVIRIQRTVVDGWRASMPPARPKEADAPKPEKRLTWIDAWASATSKDGLALTDEQWLEMTPRQVEALQCVRTERLQREEFMVGQIAAEVANYSMNRPKKLRTPESYMIHPLEVSRPSAAGLITGEYIMDQMAKARKGQ